MSSRTVQKIVPRGRSNQQHHGDQEEQRHQDILAAEVGGCEGLGHRNKKRRENRSRDASQAAEQRHDQALDQRRVAGLRRDIENLGQQHARQPGHGSTHRQDRQGKATTIDADQGRGLGVLCQDPDAQADPRAQQSTDDERQQDRGRDDGAALVGGDDGAADGELAVAEDGRQCLRVRPEYRLEDVCSKEAQRQRSNQRPHLGIELPVEREENAQANEEACGRADRHPSEHHGQRVRRNVFGHQPGAVAGNGKNHPVRQVEKAEPRPGQRDPDGDQRVDGRQVQGRNQDSHHGYASAAMRPPWIRTIRSTLDSISARFCSASSMAPPSSSSDSSASIIFAARPGASPSDGSSTR